MSVLDTSAEFFCEKLLNDIRDVNHGMESLKFFKRNATTVLIWLFVIDSYTKKKIINIEDIAREIALVKKISKPSLRLILESAKEKGFLKFTHNKKDTRSWIIEPEIKTLTEFNAWVKKFNISTSIYH